MEFHKGRLIDHVHLRAANLEATKRFYRAVLTAIGRADAIHESDRHFNADELWIDAAEQDRPSKVHLAFMAPDRETVKRFYEAALNAGGKDNGAPGERPYHPGYYGAFVFDPDGNNIEAVHHGPFKKSADSVVLTPAMPG
jgi:catechol 2,3-dioxygenase-like lactoylglutathione lyase family enzyme